MYLNAGLVSDIIRLGSRGRSRVVCGVTETEKEPENNNDDVISVHFLFEVFFDSMSYFPTLDDSFFQFSSVIDVAIIWMSHGVLQLYELLSLNIIF